MFGKFKLSLLFPLAAFASGLLATAAAGSAEPIGTIPRAKAGGCELHVWTTNNLNALFHGFRLRTGARMMDVTPEEQGAQAMRGILSPEAQADIIAKQTPGADSPFLGYRVIVHEAPIKSKFGNWLDKHVGDGPRETSSTSECYAELHLVAVTVLETALNKELHTIYVFRQFGDSATAVRTVRDAAATRPEEFKTSRVEQSEQGSEALRDAFRRGIANILAWKKLGRT